MHPGVSTIQIDFGLEERFQRLRADLGVESFGLNFMRLAPRQRGRIHAHERQEEVYAVLEGILTVYTGEDESFELGRGGVARVAPDVRRQLVNRHKQVLAILAVGASAGHEGRDGRAYTSWDETGEGRPPQEVPLPEDLALD
jgi:mannose-6-phosphate isomerase-like protein (cupin superfamily)